MGKMNKEQLNVSVSLNTKQIAEEYGLSNKFSSTSNFVESAILYYKGALDRDSENELLKCKKELERVKEEHERDRNTLLIILSNHKELLDEVNNVKE